MADETTSVNTRMPYMLFNWANHTARVWRLSLEERGLLDTIRCELWATCCRMPLETLRARLRIVSGSPLEALLDGLVRGDYLRLADGWISDEFLLAEFKESLRKAEINRANGRKGGRPARKADTSDLTGDGDF